MYHSSQIGPTDFTNSSGYRNTEVDTVFDQAAQAVDRNEARRIYERSALTYDWYTPTRAGWERGERGVACVVADPDGRPLTAPA